MRHPIYNVNTMSKQYLSDRYINELSLLCFYCSLKIGGGKSLIVEVGANYKFLTLNNLSIISKLRFENKNKGEGNSCICMSERQWSFQHCIYIINIYPTFKNIKKSMFSNSFFFFQTRPIWFRCTVLFNLKIVWSSSLLLFTPWELFTSVSAYGLSLEFEWQLVSRTLLSILTVLNNVVVWMLSTRPLIFKSSSPFNNPLVTVPKASITIGIIITFIFDSFFNSQQGWGTYPSFHILSVLFCGQPGH